MKSIDFEKYKFKLRSLPNTKTLPRYFHCIVMFLASLAVYNLVTICLIYDDFMPRFPALFAIALPLMLIQVYTKIESEYRNISRDKVKDLIVHIRLKQNQSLREKLVDNPEILKATFEKRSLLYWAKHHKNLQAHSLLIGEMRKFQNK